jgi:hypothetical protein
LSGQSEASLDDARLRVCILKFFDAEAWEREEGLAEGRRLPYVLEALGSVRGRIALVRQGPSTTMESPCRASRRLPSRAAATSAGWGPPRRVTAAARRAAPRVGRGRAAAPRRAPAPDAGNEAGEARGDHSARLARGQVLLVSHWKDPDTIVIGGHEPATRASASWSDGRGLEERMMALDTATCMPDDILVKLDRASR